MTEEFIDVLTPAGERTGVSRTKSAIHRDGEWHRSVHVWIVTPDGRLLLQLRSSEKVTHPRKWDASCAGHVSAGETARESAIRELHEELGIVARARELDPLGEVVERASFLDGRYQENEFQSIFLLRRPVDPARLVLQKDEVEQVALVSPGELASRVARRDPDLVPHWSGYELLLRHLGPIE